MIGVRRNPDGPDVAHLDAQARSSGARLFFTQSLAHNPTGCSLTLPVAHRLLQRAAALDLRIVESDPFADVLPAAHARLAALDQLERVIYVGTFAKTLSASLRCGYIAARADVVEALRDLKMVTSVNSSGFVERIIHDLIETGRYRRHLRRLGGRIEAASWMSDCWPRQPPAMSGASRPRSTAAPMSMRGTRTAGRRSFSRRSPEGRTR